MTRNPHKTMVQSKLPSPIYDHTPMNYTPYNTITRFNGMTEQEQLIIASNLLEVAKTQGTSHYVLNISDVPHMTYATDPTDETHLDTDLSHAYLVNATVDELMSSEALGFHDLVITYAEHYGYTLMPGKYS